MSSIIACSELSLPYYLRERISDGRLCSFLCFGRGPGGGPGGSGAGRLAGGLGWTRASVFFGIRGGGVGLAWLSALCEE